MDELEQDPQDSMAAALARLRAGKATASPQDMDAALAKVRGTPSGPITPGHSKFTPEELRARADKSVDDATQETMDAQGNLIHTLQAGVGAAELGAQAIPAIGRSIPAILRGGGNALKSVSGPAVRDLALSPLSSGARWRTLSRVVDVVKNRAGKSGGPTLEGVEAPIGPVLRGERSMPFSRAQTAERAVPEIPQTMERAIATESPMGSALRPAPKSTPMTRGRPTPQPDVPQTMERPIPTQSPAEAVMESAPVQVSQRTAAQRQFQNVVDEGKSAYDASLHKGTVTDPETNWDLMQKIEAGLLKAKGKGTPSVPAWRRAAGLP